MLRQFRMDVVQTRPLLLLPYRCRVWVFTGGGCQRFEERHIVDMVLDTEELLDSLDVLFLIHHQSIDLRDRYLFSLLHGDS
ncbi:hypothetical protein D3C84_857250 [compost metagenome]